MTIVLAIIDNMPWDLISSYRPNIGINACTLQTDHMEMIFFFIPLSIYNSISVLFLSMTGLQILKVSTTEISSGYTRFDAEKSRWVQAICESFRCSLLKFQLHHVPDTFRIHGRDMEFWSSTALFFYQGFRAGWHSLLLARTFHFCHHRPAKKHSPDDSGKMSRTCDSSQWKWPRRRRVKFKILCELNNVSRTNSSFKVIVYIFLLFNGDIWK